ncbi:MAG: hypothetical protein LBF22_05660 [Deltaproteobacteria bacterium]|jgi:hypothetical protein|nr:hypothetical protein [Deltaproteobacteria bacterium]
MFNYPNAYNDYGKKIRESFEKLIGELKADIEFKTNLQHLMNQFRRELLDLKQETVKSRIDSQLELMAARNKLTRMKYLAFLGKNGGEK